jgi:hypothetical protein
MEKELSPQESLAIITSMINQTKGNMQKNGFFFILWGWTMIVANAGVYITIKFTDYPNPYLFYLVTIIAAIASVIYGSRQEKNAQSISHLDIIIKWMWMSLGISCFILCAFGSKINWQLNPVIITMMAAPTLTSGVISKFKPLIFGGIALWVVGISMFIVQDENQFLLASLAIGLGYLVPGYALKSKKN